MSPSLNEGTSGIDQTWDFSSLADDLQTTDYAASEVSITPFGNEFPMANVATTSLDFSGNEVYSYFTNNDSLYTTWGYETFTDKLIYSNPRDILHFPFTFGDSFSDTYYGSLLVGYNSGIVEISADAYGVLMLPTGTFHDCLRVREIRYDTLAAGPSPIISSDTSFKYYVPNYPEPLCQVNHHHLSDGFSFDEIYWQNISPNAVASINIESALSVFPNPCNDQVKISIPALNEKATITIHDITGRVMTKKDQITGNDILVNTSSFKEGVYLVSIEAANRKFLSSFVVER